MNSTKEMSQPLVESIRSPPLKRTWPTIRQPNTLVLYFLMYQQYRHLHNSVNNRYNRAVGLYHFKSKLCVRVCGSRISMGFIRIS